MWAFVGVSVLLFFSLAFATAYARRDEIAANWSQYRSDPLFLFAAPLFKPADDPRSPVQFASDNFKDVLLTALNKVFAVFLEPVFKILKMISDTFEESAKGLFAMRSVLTNMYQKMASVADIFQRRYNNTFHSLRMTFLKLLSAFQKSYAVGVGSVYAGISTFTTIYNSFTFMMIVAIVILAILVVMVILLFFVLAPSLPLIITVISVIAATALGGAVGGMADTFCFTHGTLVEMKDGPQPIQTVRIGQQTLTGATITGVMAFDTIPGDLYSLYGVQVSGSHVVYYNDVPIHVADHPDASPIHTLDDKLYCLITSDHRIPVRSSAGTLMFADWEELENEDDLRIWQGHVFDALNGGSGCCVSYKLPTEMQLNSESAFTGQTRIWTPVGPEEIRGIRPGSIVFSADGTPTRVTGVVRMNSSEISGAMQLDTNAWVSAGAWLFTDGVWKQPEDCTTELPSDDTWYNLFTESGTFRLCSGTHVGIGVRDFTDVGPSEIDKTYDWVLRSLQRRTAKINFPS